MAHKERLQLVSEIEKLRGSRVLCLLTGDRAPNYATIIAADAPPLLYQHLEKIGKVDQIDLLLYSRGGHTLSGFRIPGLVREYCERFAVLVPYRAHSTATLVALGADEIVMTPLAELSPVDPSTNGPFNPPAPVQVAPGEVVPTIPVSVEDVAGYLNLAREEAGIRSQEHVQTVFERLAADVRPLALGGVYRARSQIRMLIRKLLNLHSSRVSRWRANKIVKVLSEELLSHDYLITRSEAQEIGLKVKFATQDEERLMLALFRDFAAEMKLAEPFNLEAELPGPGKKTITFDRAFVESRAGTHVFRTVKEVQRAAQAVAVTTPAGVQHVQQLQAQERILREAWVLTHGEL
jgi:hypothetical protein